MGEKKRWAMEVSAADDSGAMVVDGGLGSGGGGGRRWPTTSEVKVSGYLTRALIFTIHFLCIKVCQGECFVLLSTESLCFRFQVSLERRCVGLAKTCLGTVS